MSAWAEPGRPGWYPDAWDASGFPWAFAGLAVGGVWLDEPGSAPHAPPEPGVATAGRALGFSDSLDVSPNADAAWRGFGAALATLQTSTAPPGRGHANATVQFVTGSNGFETDALGLERGQARSGLRVEMTSGTRGAAGALEREGRHMWGLSARGVRGRHEWAATYAQRGSGERLADGDEEDAAGEGGTLDYTYRATGWLARVNLGRGYSHHESYGDTLTYSRRDAQENRAAGELEGAIGGSQFGLRAEWRNASATRATGGLPVSDRDVTLGWTAGRLERALGPGRLEATLGAGRDGGSQRTVSSPALAWTLEGAGGEARLSVGRLIDPVWADLAPGAKPFLQDTWAAGAELATRGSRAQMRALLLAGRTEDRALVTRLPLADLWMRAGIGPDALRYRFALASLASGARLGAFDAAGEGFLLGRDRDGSQPQVDPSWGARASAGYVFTAFQGDLHGVLQAEAEWVGERETEEPTPTMLAAITSLGAAAVLTISDATFTLRARNLADRPQPQVWINPVTGGPALGPGLEVRGTLTWRLFN